MGASHVHAKDADRNASSIAARLKAAYPQSIQDIDGARILFRNGMSLPLDDGTDEKDLGEWLANPDIQDMFRFDYPAGTSAQAPAPGFDPGRARNAAFFATMYGDCRTGEFESSLKGITWLRKKAPQALRVSAINGVAEQLQAISDELDALPASFDEYITPSAGTYNCRPVAGTANMSAHGYGIAIDIATKHSHYWRWAEGGPAGPIAFANEIPREIIEIFERHGFIWGGRWYHYDTMHFEYRPELLTVP